MGNTLSCHASVSRLTVRFANAGSLDAVNRLTNSIAVLTTISFGGWLAVCGKLTVGFIYTAFTFSFQLAMGFSNLVTMTGSASSAPRVAFETAHAALYSSRTINVKGTRALTSWLTSSALPG